VPRIEQARAGESKVSSIPCHQRQVVNYGGCSDQSVDHRQRRPSRQIAPAGGLGIADNEDPLSEELTQAAEPKRQPVRAFRVALATLHDAFGDFADREKRS
jgi:hypothetical protein